MNEIFTHLLCNSYSMRVFEIQPAAFLNKDNNLYTAFQIMVLILSKRKQAIQEKTYFKEKIYFLKMFETSFIGKVKFYTYFWA